MELNLQMFGGRGGRSGAANGAGNSANTNNFTEAQKGNLDRAFGSIPEGYAKSSLDVQEKYYRTQLSNTEKEVNKAERNVNRAEKAYESDNKDARNNKPKKGDTDKTRQQH